MPNIKSAKKRVLTAERNRVRNRDWKSRIRTQKNKLEESLKTADTAAAETNLGALYQLLDKAVGKGVLHQNTAARQKSSLAKKVFVLKSGS